MSVIIDSMENRIEIGALVALNYLVTPNGRRCGGSTRRIAFGRVLELHEKTLGVLLDNGTYIPRAQPRSTLKVLKRTTNPRSRYALVPIKTNIVRARIVRTTPECYGVEHNSMYFLFRKTHVIRR